MSFSQRISVLVSVLDISIFFYVLKHWNVYMQCGDDNLINDLAMSNDYETFLYIYDSSIS